MTLLRTSASGLAALALEGTVGVRIAGQMSMGTGRRPSPSEVLSWERSLPVLAHDLLQAGLDDVEVLIEYQLPLTSKRIDAVLAGAHPRTGNPSYVAIELKQWSQVARWKDDPTLLLVAGTGGQPRLHPLLQVQAYCEYLIDFTRALESLDDAVAGAAYLHNATTTLVSQVLQGVPETEHGRLFTAANRGAFQEFLRSRLSHRAPGAPYADLLLRSAAAPSRQLLAVAADEVQRREMFVLLDAQRVAYQLVLRAVEEARAKDAKTVVVITGGPGTGKSVIALSLLGELARRGRTVLHATGSRSFTQTLRKVAGRRTPRVQRMFKYFNQFMDAESNGLDVLILDEAHRIRETSVDRYTRAAMRSERPQIDELMAAARVPVFLLDEHQVVRPGEQGTVQQIAAHAAKLGLAVDVVDLNAQFRCGGSQAYLDWVVRLLGLSGAAPRQWHGDPAFDVRMAHSPQELDAFMQAKSAEGTARITAGYCWSWSDPRVDGSLVADILIEDWSRPWNLKGDRSVDGAPPAALWATDPGGVDQVGCVYTAQGFEYDWSAVIIGPDLLWREGRFVSERSANRDPDLRNRTRVNDQEFDHLVRNVYKVLLTRGVRGTIIYSTDAQTREALDALISSRPGRPVSA